jgi:hypothetical protein
VNTECTPISVGDWTLKQSPIEISSLPPLIPRKKKVGSEMQMAMLAGQLGVGWEQSLLKLPGGQTKDGREWNFRPPSFSFLAWR